MIIIIAYILIDLNKITIVQQWFEKKLHSQNIAYKI